MMPTPFFQRLIASGIATALASLPVQAATAQTALPSQTLSLSAEEASPAPTVAAVADRQAAMALDDAALAQERGGQAVVVGNQTLNSSLSGNTIAGNYTAGAISLSDNAFANFNGMGNVVINSGAQANLQSAMNITINLGN